MVNIEQNYKQLTISYVNKKGDIAFHIVPIPQTEKYEWKKISKNLHNKFSWDGDPVAPTPVKRLNNYRVTEFLESLDESEKEIFYEFNLPKKYFIDIETDISEEKWKPSNPQGAIQTISIVSGEKSTVIVLSTKNLSSDRQDNVRKRINKHFEKYNLDVNFKFMYFATEFEMLMSFFDQAFRKMALVTGWNVIEYDWSYLINRAELIGIDPTIASPTGKLHGKFRLPMHKIVVDYLEIYKKWDRKVDVKESNTLDWVSEEVLGINKIHYNGSLSDLYTNDFESFVFYNAVDSLLVKYIDIELNVLMPYLQLSNITKTEHHRAFSPVAMLENVLVVELTKLDKVLLYNKENESEERNYEGAYVKQPMKGFHQLLACFDFSSLYPTTMRQWYISPEGFIEVDKNFDISTRPDLVKCANGAIFKKDPNSILPYVLTRIFTDRKQAQSISKIAEAEIYKLKEYL